MIAAGNNQWTDSYPKEFYAEDLAAGALWIAETDDCAVAGVAAFTTAPEPMYAAAGWNVDETAVFTHRLAVHPEQRGRGIAFALMQHGEQVARDRGIQTMRVDTGVKNVPAQRLIARLGYRFVAEIQLAIREELRVVCYEKRLDDGETSVTQ